LERIKRSPQVVVPPASSTAVPATSPTPEEDDKGPKCKDTKITYNPDYGKKSCKKKENPNPMVYP
jgi:hypothetical protein